MASLDSSNQFDPTSYFHGLPCPVCKAARLDRRNFRIIECVSAHESCFILKCYCQKQLVLGLVIDPGTYADQKTLEGYLARSGMLLTERTKFYCPSDRCTRRRPKYGAWFVSAGKNEFGFDMLTLDCASCQRKSPILLLVRQKGRDSLPSVPDELDMPPLQAQAAGPITEDYVIGFDKTFSDQEVWAALSDLRSAHLAGERRSLPAQTETRPESRP